MPAGIHPTGAPSSLWDCTHLPKPSVSQMLQALSSRLATFVLQWYLTPVLHCTICLQEAVLASGVLSVLHHLLLYGGVLQHARSPLLPFPLHPQIPSNMVWFLPVLCGLRSMFNNLIWNSGTSPGSHSWYSSGTGCVTCWSFVPCGMQRSSSM